MSDRRYRPYLPRPFWAMVLLLFAVVWVFAVMVEGIPPVPGVQGLFARAFFGLLPPRAAQALLGLFSWQIWRHVLVPGLAGVFAATLVATHFLQSFHRLPSLQIAFTYLDGLIRALFVTDFDAPFRPTSPGRRLLFAGIPAVLSLFGVLFILRVLTSGTGGVVTLSLALLLTILSGIFAVQMLFGVRARPVVSATGTEFAAQRAENPLLQVGGPGWLRLTNPHEAAVTMHNGRHSRVLGMGLHRLLPYENVATILDLQQQTRKGKGVFLTWEGLEVGVDIGVTFSIARGRSSAEGAEIALPTPTMPYPYDENAARAAANIQTVVKGSCLPWQALPLAAVRGQLAEIVASRPLQELFVPTGGAAPQPLRQEALEATQGGLWARGIRLIHVHLGPFLINEESLANDYIRAVRARERQPVLAPEPETVAQDDETRAEQKAEAAVVRALLHGVEEARQKPADGALVALNIMVALDDLARQAQQRTQGNGDLLLARLRELRRELVREQRLS